MQTHASPTELSSTPVSLLPAPKPSEEWALLFPASQSQLTRLYRSYRENEKYNVLCSVDKKEGEEIFKQCTGTLKLHPTNASALSMSAWCHVTGAGTPVSFVKSIDLYKQAADKGSAIAKNNIAMIRLIQSLQLDSPVGLIRAVEELKQLATATPPVLPALFNYARCLEEKCGAESDSKQQLALITKAVDLNYAPAQHYLSICFLEGEIVKKDDQKALYYSKQAVDQGYSIAYAALAELLEVNNPVLATEYLKKAVAALSSMHLLGEWYENGLGGLGQDTKLALEQYKASAKAGNEYAGFHVHRLYTDDGNAKEFINEKEANHYLYLSAQQGNAVAQYEIFRKSLINDEVNVTQEEMRFLELAAKQHHTEAMQEFAFQLHQNKQYRESQQYYEKLCNLKNAIKSEYPLCRLPRLATAALHAPRNALPELTLWNGDKDAKYLKKISAEQLSTDATTLAKQSDHVGLQKLTMKGNNNAVDIRPLLQALPYFNQLFDVNLSGSFLTHDFLKALFPVLDVHRRLIHLTLANCELNDENADTFARWLQDHQQLASLSLLSCVMSGAAAQKIFSALQGNASLSNLTIEGLSSEALLPLQKMLSDVKTHLHRVTFTNGDFREIPRDFMMTLVRHPSLTSLKFEKCSFSKKSQRELIAATQNNRTLKELIVTRANDDRLVSYHCSSWFNVGPGHLTSLTVPEADLKESKDLLKNNPNLKELAFSPLDNFKIKDNAVEHATSLITSNQLSDLVLGIRHTHLFRPQDLPALKNAVESSSSLCRLTYSYTKNSPEDDWDMIVKQNEKLEKDVLSPHHCRNQYKQNRSLFNWKQLCVLMAFVRANSQSQIRTSVVPLLGSILNSCGTNTASKELIRPSRFMDSLFFRKEIPAVSKKRKRKEAEHMKPVL